MKSRDQQLLEEAYQTIVKKSSTNLLNRLLEEGYYDPAIFKAIFMIGGPGSGKTYVTKKLGLVHLGFTQINSDYALEAYMKRLSLDLKMPKSQKDQRDQVRAAAVSVTGKREALAMSQRMGICFDFTGSSLQDTIAVDNQLKQLGYETAMVFVNTNLDVALQRNELRERSVPVEVVNTKWYEVQQNIGAYKNHFKNNFFVIDNNAKDDADVEHAAETERQITQTFKQIQAWSKQQPRNPEAIKQIKAMALARNINI